MKRFQIEILRLYRSGILQIFSESIKMQTTIVKLGNSQGIRIPKSFLKNIHISENDIVDITLSDEKIIIKKIKYKKHKTTQERLIEFYGTNFDQEQMEYKEIDWGKPTGKEIW
jgi:antitoxin MazE